jgi:hypothetical protein
MVRMKIFGVALGALFFTAAAGAAGPGEWQEPTVAHEGTRVMKAAGEQVRSHYRYTPPGKYREEMSAEGMSMAIIVRQDLDLVWTVLPNNMYMEIPMDEAEQRSAAEAVVEFDVVGREDVLGWPTTKYRVVSMEDGERWEGHFWVTEHWIPIKAEMHYADDPSDRVEWEVHDLKITAQDASFFELPPGATKMEGFGPDMMRGMGFTGELLDEAIGTAQDTAREESRESVKDTVREGVRGLFKR